MMLGRPECEMFAKRIVPVLRARVAQTLAKDYDLHQYEISEMLGVTQAAVSFYLAKARGASTSLLRKFPEIDKTAKRIARALAGGSNRSVIVDLQCDLCKKIRKKRAFKALV